MKKRPKKDAQQIPDGLDPPSDQAAGEAALNGRLDTMLGRAKAGNDQWSAIWEDGRRMVFGDQLAGKKPKKGWTRVQVNILFSGVAQSLAAITQRRLDIMATPVEKEDAEASELWEGLLRYDADREIHLNTLLKRCVLVGKTDGQWVVRPFWNPRARWDEKELRWHGGVRTTLLRNEDVYVDDANADTLAEANAICTERMVSVDQLLRELPNFREEILDAAEAYGGGGADAAVGEMTAQIGQSITTSSSGVQRDAGTIGGAREGRLVENVYGKPSGPWDGSEGGAPVGDGRKLPSHVPFQCFFWRDWEEEDVRVVFASAEELIETGEAQVDATGALLLDPETGMALSVKEGTWPVREATDADAGLPATATAATLQRPKYPYGRYCYRVGRKILNLGDGEQRWPIDAGWPFIEGINWPLAYGWRGENDVEMAGGLQDVINALYASCVNNVRQVGDPKTKVAEGALAASAGEEGTRRKVGVGSGPGTVIKTTAEGLDKVKTEPPPPMNKAHFDLIAPFERAGRDLTGSGTQPIGLGRGEGSGGGMTAREASLRDANSSMRSTMSGVLADDFVVRLMTYIAALERYYRKPGDIVKIVGRRRAREVKEFSQKAVDFVFDVTLRATSTAAFDLESRQHKLLTLSENELIGPAVLKELIEAFRDVLPDPASVLARCSAWARIQEQLAMEEAAAKAQEGSPAAGGPGGNGQWPTQKTGSPQGTMPAQPSPPMQAKAPPKLAGASP